LQRPCNRLACTVASGLQIWTRPGCPSSRSPGDASRLAQTVRTDAPERTHSLPGRGEHIGASDFHSELFVIGGKNTKRTISVRFTIHRSIWCTFTESHSIGDDCVYRAAPEMNRSRAEARTESGATLANDETASSIVQGGQMNASAGSEARCGTAHLRTTSCASNFEIAPTQPRGRPLPAGMVPDTDFAHPSNAMTVVDTPIPSDWPERSTGILSVRASRMACRSVQATAARAMRLANSTPGRFYYGRGP
jgi:hypothetical protein